MSWEVRFRLFRTLDSPDQDFMGRAKTIFYLTRTAAALAACFPALPSGSASREMEKKIYHFNRQGKEGCFRMLSLLVDIPECSDVLDKHFLKQRRATCLLMSNHVPSSHPQHEGAVVRVACGSSFTSRTRLNRRSAADVMEVKVCLMGDGGVGKSCLSLQYAYGKFIDVWDPSIEDTYRIQKIIDGNAVMVSLLDTAGQEEFEQMRDSWVRTNDTFLLCFSLTDRRTFDQLDDFHERILRVKDAAAGEVPVVLVANKKDLPRVVTSEEAAAKAERMGVPLIETSAKEHDGVDAAFEQAVREHRAMLETKGLDPRRIEQRKGLAGRLKDLGCSIL